ncbi:hypothetical protein FRUB_03053 [Fimbriiglobus ruber]|uniref:Uncharacterized protein n=1 Tax=Fimbriiglobus ruber TaxID=1908690 RepID=A0A225DUY1_9BACT|nr:hypothetical protein FRUB_03053 [Fimbriiglobus ruber]
MIDKHVQPQANRQIAPVIFDGPTEKDYHTMPSVMIRRKSFMFNVL